MDITIMEKKSRIFIFTFFCIVSFAGCAYNHDHYLIERKQVITQYLNKAEKTPPLNVEITYAVDIPDRGWNLKDYSIEKGDVLSVSVWQVEELKRTVVVRPDGKISFPLIGDVQAEGKTIQALRAQITSKLAKFIRNPQVSVIIKEFGGKRAVVLNELGGGGVIRFTTPIKVLEALAMAGGYNTDLNLKKIYIIRESEKGGQPVKIIIVNAQDVLRKGDVRENIYVKSGDIIFLARGAFASVKYFQQQIQSVISMSYQYATKGRNKATFQIPRPTDYY